MITPIRFIPVVFVTRKLATGTKPHNATLAITGTTSSAMELTIALTKTWKKNHTGDYDYYCKICKEEIFPFQTVTNELYNTAIVENINIDENLNLKPTPSTTLKILFNDIEKIRICQNQEDFVKVYHVGFYQRPCWNTITWRSSPWSML